MFIVSILFVVIYPLLSTSKDVSRLSFATSMKDHYDNGLVEAQLFCGGNFPTLLHTEDPDQDPDDTSFFDYQHFYTRRKIVLEQDELEGVSFERLSGLPHFRVLKAGTMLHSDGWNKTHEIPAHQSDASHIKSGNTLLWTKPPSNHLDLMCENSIELKPSANLLVIATWFPGNFGHFLHDALPLIFWLFNFGMDDRDRLGLVDTWLHRTLLKWLHPELADKVIWLQVGSVNCLSQGNLISVQSAKANMNGRMIRKKDPSTVWSLRNFVILPSLSLNFGLQMKSKLLSVTP